MSAITNGAVLPASTQPRLSTLIWLLGATQIVGIGSIYYSYALLAPGVAAELHTSLPFLFGMLSIGLFVGGLGSPRIGRWVDRLGGPAVLCTGSIVTAAVFLLLGLAPNIEIFAGGVILLQVVSVAALFGAATPTLAHYGGAGAHRAIAFLTALVGLSSTIFFPLIGVLETSVGWRGTYFAMAAMHLFIALPIHFWLYRRLPFVPVVQTLPAPGDAPPTRTDIGSVKGVHRRFAFWAVGISFALSGAIAQAVAFQVVPVLQGIGLGASAYVVGMILGPAQVVIRFGQVIIFRKTHPLDMGLLSSVCLPLSIILLLLGFPPLIAGIAFVTLYGLGQGLNAIVSGTLPLDLFGRMGYAELLGKMAMIRVLLSAPAPFALSFLWEAFSLEVALYVFIAMGVVAVIPLIMLKLRLTRAGDMPTRA